MNQRALSSSSMLFTKGVTLKSGDWSSGQTDASGFELQRPRSNSNASQIRRMTSSSSNSSFHRMQSSSSFKQFDLQPRSSSSFASNQSGLFGRRPSHPKQNSTWENANEARPADSLDMFELKRSDSKVGHGERKPNMFLDGNLNVAPMSSSKPNMFLDGNCNVAPRRNSKPNVFLDSNLDLVQRRNSKPNMFLDGSYNMGTESNSKVGKSLSNLLTLQEESTRLQQNACWDDEDMYVVSRSSPERSYEDEEEEFVVRTFKEKAPKQVDTLGMTTSDLASLKNDDAFMYYSIPAAKKAAWKGNDIDARGVGSSLVTRKSVISFESADLFFDSDDDDEMDTDSDNMSIPSLYEGVYQANVDADKLLDELLVSFLDSQK